VRSLVVGILLLPLLGNLVASQTKQPAPSKPSAKTKSTPKPTAPPTVGSPEWLVQQYFLTEKPADLRPYLGGEMLKHPDEPSLGSIAPPYVKMTYRPIRVGSEKAVYAVAVHDSTGIRDLYCHMAKSGSVWKIMAILWMATYEVYPGPIALLKAQKSLPDSAKASLSKMQLSIASDSALKRHFAANRELLDSLLSLTRSYGSILLARNRCGDPAFELQYGGLYKQVCPCLNQAQVWALFHGSEECPNATFFELGGLQENVVGFMYVPEGSSPPPLSYDRYFLIESLAPHWYLYKAD
jgi:hypothetical protein